MNKNIEYCKKLFESMLESEDATEYYIVLDYFSLKVIELLENFELNKAKEYTTLFQVFSAQIKDTPKVSKFIATKRAEIETFFFTLGNLLVDKYEFIENKDNEFTIEYIKNL